MSPQTLREALEAVAAWPRTPQVHFTGGEPFLHFPLLLEGVRIAVELGIPCYVETSANWCLDEAEAVERFRALREAELGAVLVSGRAGYELGHLVPRYPVDAFAHDNCAREVLFAHHSHFDLYGNYISGFCGGLTVGDWHERSAERSRRSLPQLLADFQAGRHPPLIAVLIERGPHGLFEMARDRYGYHPLAEGYTGKCHLCVDVRRHLARKGDFVRPRGFYENIAVTPLEGIRGKRAHLRRGHGWRPVAACALDGVA
jgi:hypothetical protein